MQLGTGNGRGRFIQDDVVVREWWFQGIRFDRGTSFARKMPSRFRRNSEKHKFYDFDGLFFFVAVSYWLYWLGWIFRGSLVWTSFLSQC